MTKIKAPFFVINPKAYLYGEEIVSLAKKAEELANQFNVDILFTAQLIDMPKIKEIAPSLILTAQHFDPIEPGRGMGHVLPDALAYHGVQASFLNHAEFPMTLAELDKAIKLGRKHQILSVVCASSYEETKAIASLKPDIMVCEPTELIGTGETSNDEYMQTTQRIIRETSPHTLVLQAAGISSAEDVYNAFKNGADGTGGTSGIVCAESPHKVLDQMFNALDQARKDFKQ